MSLFVQEICWSILLLVSREYGNILYDVMLWLCRDFMPLFPTKDQ